MPDTKQSILLGALVTGILGTSYLGLITTLMCCMNVLAGALVAIWHYTETNELTISGGKAAGMGALVAVGGSVIASVLTLILMTAGIRHDVVMAEFMLNNLGDQLPPESIQGLEDQVEAAIKLGPFFFNVLVSTAVSSAFGAGAGAIGAKMFKKGGDEPTDLSVIEEL